MQNSGSIGPTALVTNYRFINPKPLTKKGIQESNRQIHLIYTDKQGEQLHYVAVAAKVGGSAFGTIFTKVSSTKRWIGKIGETRDLIQQYNYTFEDINIDVIFEKLASDLYEEFGRGLFKVPKTRLSEQPLINAFGPTKPRWNYGDYFFDFIKTNSDKSSLRIMSKFVTVYENFKDALTQDLNGTPITCLEFIKKHHYPPETVITPTKQAVPLYGLMEIVSVGRVLADTDILGGGCDNAGFTWLKDKETEKIIAAQAIKIDPGRALNFSNIRGSNLTELNWVLNTKCNSTISTKLDNIKDIQTAQNCKSVFFHWDALTQRQKETFLGILFNSSRYLQAPNVLHYLFFREGKFKHLPENIARKFQNDMKEWLDLQFNIYSDDLQFFHEKYPEISLKAYYIDKCGHLKIHMNKESVPIQELFTELIIQNVNHPKQNSPIPVPLTSENKNEVSLQNLFENCRTVLLVGRAGIGNSTLCQKMVHDWSSGGLWNDQFDGVYLLPLRLLNDLMIEEDPYQFLILAFRHLFHDLPSLEYLLMSLENKRVLIILDGYNEAKQELTKMVQKILQKTPFHVLITSRFKLETLSFDRTVENIGFSEEQVKTYIDRFSKRHEDNKPLQRQDFLFSYIKENPNLYALANVPLQLQMILSLHENEESLGQTTSLTTLYQEIIKQICQWNLPKLGDEERENMLKNFGKIAWMSLKKDKQVIPREKIQHLIANDLLEVGILKEMKKGDNYQFLYLTFQEYLAADHISRSLPAKQKHVILENRAKTRYQFVLAFLAGLIDSKTDRIEHFFETLCKGSKSIDLFYLLELTLSCLSECKSYQQPPRAVDAFIRENPLIWELFLGDGYKTYLSVGNQKQNQVLCRLKDHYSQEKKEILQHTCSPITDTTLAGIQEGISVYAKCGDCCKKQWLHYKNVDNQFTINQAILTIDQERISCSECFKVFKKEDALDIIALSQCECTLEWIVSEKYGSEQEKVYITLQKGYVHILKWLPNSLDSLYFENFKTHKENK